MLEFLSSLKLPSYKLVIFIVINSYILTENKSFKTFLKENEAIASGSFYIFTKKMLNLDFNMMLIVRIE